MRMNECARNCKGCESGNPQEQGCLSKGEEKKVEKILTEQLNEALESVNADGSFKVVKTDLDKMKFTVEFDIVEIPEDNYIGFVGY